VTKLATLFVLAALLTGCAREVEPIGARTRDAAPMRAGAIPPKLAGLDVKQESLKETLTKAERAHYVDATALFSLRKADNELQATLQVSRFRDDPDYRTRTFRRLIVNRIGSTQPRALKIGTDVVHLSSAKGLLIAMWFRPDHMFVLAIRDNYTKPKSLIRPALAISP
jgi:hypothetical protein